MVIKTKIKLIKCNQILKKQKKWFKSCLLKTILELKLLYLLVTRNKNSYSCTSIFQISEKRIYKNTGKHTIKFKY